MPPLPLPLPLVCKVAFVAMATLLLPELYLRGYFFT